MIKSEIYFELSKKLNIAVDNENKATSVILKLELEHYKNPSKKELNEIVKKLKHKILSFYDCPGTWVKLKQLKLQEV